MFFPKKITKLQMTVAAFIIAVAASLGYLFYDYHKANLRDKEIVEELKAENLDLNQDLEILKDKYDKLKKDMDLLTSKVTKISSGKKYYKKKKITSAGRKSNYKKSRVNYKSLYFKLKKECSKYSHKKSSSLKYKSDKKYKPT